MRKSPIAVKVLYSFVIQAFLLLLLLTPAVLCSQPLTNDSILKIDTAEFSDLDFYHSGYMAEYWIFSKDAYKSFNLAQKNQNKQKIKTLQDSYHAGSFRLGQKKDYKETTLVGFTQYKLSICDREFPLPHPVNRYTISSNTISARDSLEIKIIANKQEFSTGTYTLPVKLIYASGSENYEIRNGQSTIPLQKNESLKKIIIGRTNMGNLDWATTSNTVITLPRTKFIISDVVED